MQLCATIPKIGTNVVIAYPDRTVRSRIISPILIGNVAERKKFNTLISDVQVSGSGVFDPERRCLLGIMSASVRIHSYQRLSDRAGYFVSTRRASATGWPMRLAHLRRAALRSRTRRWPPQPACLHAQKNGAATTASGRCRPSGFGM